MPAIEIETDEDQIQEDRIISLADSKFLEDKSQKTINRLSNILENRKSINSNNNKIS